MVATTDLGPSDRRTTETFVKNLPHGPVDDVAAFLQKLTTALGTPFAGSVLQFSTVGNNISVSSNLASANMVEDLCILTNQQLDSVNEVNAFNSTVVGDRLADNSRSANKWLGNLTGIPTPLASFTIGPVTCPKGLSCVYLHSDKLAGARDTVGPVPGQRATIAKVDLGSSGVGEHVSVSLYRPHLYTTLSRQDVDVIDFSLRDSRGATLDLDGTRLAFVVTFDTSHLLA